MVVTRNIETMARIPAFDSGLLYPDTWEDSRGLNPQFWILLLLWCRFWNPNVDLYLFDI